MRKLIVLVVALAVALAQVMFAQEKKGERMEKKG